MTTAARARTPRSARALLTLAGAALILAAMVGAVGGAQAAAGAVAPNRVGELDCNGFSHIQRSVKSTLACQDPRIEHAQRFEDNGWYIGHDEPSVRFISNAPGSGSTVNMTEVLSRDPAAAPTVSAPGGDITHNFELTIAPWISMDICDPNSTPLLPCTPRSDGNAPSGSYPGAGAAFLELQFYPPGFAPFVDSASCDDTHWCSALTIDSLECTQSGDCNNNCVEPVNFGFIQTNGVPTGPPSPQEADLATFTPNSHTLLMNPGDRIQVSVFDATISGGHALETKEQDLTTGQTGWMIASAANGFMNTSIADCSGTPFNFEPEYDRAAAANLLPWGPGAYDINNEFEVGHFEPCTRVTTSSTEDSDGFKDTYFNHCVGPYESTYDDSSAEPNDAPCFYKGDTHDGTAAPNQVTGCLVFLNAIGDLDYDGTSYWPDWPEAQTPGAFPSTFLDFQPTTVGGAYYPQMQFVTDMSATESGCNLSSGSGCVMPPPGPGHFYPYWTLAAYQGHCVWEFGNVSRGGDDFGRYQQYGAVTPSSLGAFQSAVQTNPRCSG